MRVVITGGGTGGHTSAGLAVAAALKRRGIECAWIGSRTGIEARRVPEAGLPYYAIPTGKQNSFAAQNLPSFGLFVRRQGGVPVSLAPVGRAVGGLQVAGVVREVASGVGRQLLGALLPRVVERDDMIDLDGLR